MTKSIRIHTLEARGNIMLDVIAEEFRVAPEQMAREIQRAHKEVCETLATKGIDYAALRTALVPLADRREVCLVFDSSQIDTYSYGAHVFERVMPLLDRRASHSVLTGDLLSHSSEMNRRLPQELARSLFEANPYEYRHSSQFYLVYVNNLSDTHVLRFHIGLQTYKPYCGYIDCTYASWMKLAISTMLPADFIVHRGLALSEHEDDRPHQEDINIRARPFEENGLRVRSIPSLYYGLFLSYKIERPPFPGDRDVEFSLNAISATPATSLNVNVRVDAAKVGYLMSRKRGVFQRAGLTHLDAGSLSTLIADRLTSNYIYDLEYNPSHNLIRFNTLIEVSPPLARVRHRFTVGLEFIPTERAVRVITMY
jgi:hypothetical protein